MRQRNSTATQFLACTKRALPHLDQKLYRLIAHSLSPHSTGSQCLTYAGLLKKEGLRFLRRGNRHLATAYFVLTLEVLMHAVTLDESIIATVTPTILELNDLLLENQAGPAIDRAISNK